MKVLIGVEYGSKTIQIDEEVKLPHIMRGGNANAAIALLDNVYRRTRAALVSEHAELSSKAKDKPTKAAELDYDEDGELEEEQNG